MPSEEELEISKEIEASLEHIDELIRNNNLLSEKTVGVLQSQQAELEKLINLGDRMADIDGFNSENIAATKELKNLLAETNSENIAATKELDNLLNGTRESEQDTNEKLKARSAELERVNGLLSLQKDLTGSLVDIVDQLGRASIYDPESAKMFGETISESITSLAQQGSAAEEVLNRITEIKKKLMSEDPAEQRAAAAEILSGAKETNEADITDKNAQIKTAEKLTPSPENDKRIKKLKEELEALKDEREKIAEAIADPKSAAGQEVMLTTITQVTKQQKILLTDVTKGFAELFKGIKGPSQEVLDNLVARRQVLDATVNLSDSLITGIGASAELRMKQAANSMQQADALQKQYDDMAETVGELQNIQLQGGVLSGQQHKELAATMREMDGIEASILSKRMEGLNAVKQLREGYLDALTAMQFGQGVFMEMVVTQEKNLGSLVRNIREVPRGLRTGTSVGEGAVKGQYGIGGLMGGTGANGEYDNKLMIDVSKDLTDNIKILSNKVSGFATALPGMTALGFQGNKHAGAVIEGQRGPFTTSTSGAPAGAVGGAGGGAPAGAVGGAGGVPTGGTGVSGEYYNKLMIDSNKDLTNVMKILSDRVSDMTVKLPVMTDLGFEGSKSRGAAINGENTPFTRAGGAVGVPGAGGAAGAGLPRVDTTGLANAFRDALMSQVKPMSETFKAGLEQVFSVAFEEFRNEITETMRG